MSTVIQIDDEPCTTVDRERITLGVQGMTCTGCQSNLHNVLDSIKEVSHITTSLLHGQAEFNLKASASVNSGNIARIVQHKTGFTCTKLHHNGEDLDLVLPVGVTNLDGPWPQGLIDLTYTEQDRVRISYDPKAVGARTLLSHPFFRSARFAPPIAADLMVVPDMPVVCDSLLGIGIFIFRRIRAMAGYGKSETRDSLITTGISTILTIPVIIVSYTGNSSKFSYGLVCLLLATAVQIVAWKFYLMAYKTLRDSRTIEMDMLIVLSSSTAYLYSVVAFAINTTHKVSNFDELISSILDGPPTKSSTPVFFETSTLIVTLIMVGRTAAVYARQKAVEADSSQSLQVQAAIVVTPNGEERIDARLLQYGDTFKVLPDTGIVTDGIILQGETEVDESLITGEALLIWKTPGMSVIAGTLNHSGTLVVELTQLPSENTVKKVNTMVDEAKSSKAKVQEIADRVARYFTYVILAITAVVFLIWVVVGKNSEGPLAQPTTSQVCINAMTYAIATLVVSCPCAIGLAVPMVLIVASGVGAKHGLIFRAAQTIETARKVTHVVFDKTGTLTQGNLVVAAEIYLSPPEHLDSMILGLISDSTHPVSRCIARHLRVNSIEPAVAEAVLSTPGKGMQGSLNGTILKIGNPKWLGVSDSAAVQVLLQRNLTIVCVELDGDLAAVFGLQDELRPDAVETVAELKRRAISVSLLSGDNEKAVNKVGIELGIPWENIRSCCSPAEKQTYVRGLLAIKNSTVLFCGDGTNDAVALARASIGLHMNGGTDVARSAADVILMNSSLKRIITLIDLSKAFYRRVVFNFVWCFAYNLLALLFAAGFGQVFTISYDDEVDDTGGGNGSIGKVRISPEYAGLGELVSVLPVIAIAMQLRWKKF